VVHRLLVLGHSGFIGRALCEAVRTCNPAVDLKGVSLEAVDLSAPECVRGLASALDGVDSIVVLAGVKKQLGDSAAAFRQNLGIAEHVCEALRLRPVRRIVFFSSAEVYGEQTHDTRMSEVTPVRPTSYYGVAKFASEGLFRKLAEATGASLLILRPPLVFGPGDGAASYGPSGFVRAAVRGDVITLWGDGCERREFLYLNDLVEVTRRLLFSSVHGVINVSSGRHHSFQDILHHVSVLLGGPPAVESRARTRHSVDQGYVNERLRAILPDIEFTSLEAALGELIQAERVSATAR